MKKCKSCFRYSENRKDAAAKGLTPRREFGIGYIQCRRPRKGVQTHCCMYHYDLAWDGEKAACEHHEYRVLWNLRNWWYYRIVHTARDIWTMLVRYPLGVLRAPQPISWELSYDGASYPMCPHCGEFLYKFDRCPFCGQRIIKDQRVEKLTRLPEIKHMDCPQCGGEGTLAYVEAAVNGHKHGECSLCGMRFIE